MKSILVVIPSFHHGGTNRVFLNMIDLFDFEAHGCTVDLLCVKYQRNDTYYDAYKSRDVRILQNNALMASLLGYGGTVFNKALRICFHLLPQSLQECFLKRLCRKYGGCYDTVIAMEEGVATRIASYISAGHHIAWVQSMLENYSQYTDMQAEVRCYAAFDRVVCVSEACRADFLKFLPDCAEKVTLIHNVINRGEIICKSEEPQEILFSQDHFNIVSVGRLDPVKQFDRIPQIAAALLQRGCVFSWYLIGSGNERRKIEHAIKSCGVENHVFLLGKKDNPYPYIRAADLVAITSASETFCLVIAEAGILRTPVISTDFVAANEAKVYADEIDICALDAFPDCIAARCNAGKTQRPPAAASDHRDAFFRMTMEQLEQLLSED